MEDQRGEDNEIEEGVDSPSTIEKNTPKKRHILMSILLLLVIMGFLAYLTRSIQISSCTSLSGQTEGEIEAVSSNTEQIDEVPCPEPDKADTVSVKEVSKVGGSITIKPTTPPAEPATPSNTGGGSGRSRNSTSPQNASAVTSSNETNQTQPSLSPEETSGGAQKSAEANISEQSSFSQAAIDEFIAVHNLNVDCTVTNQTIPGVSSLISLRGHRTITIFWKEVNVPVDVRLVVSEDKIIFECIKTAWWAYLLR